VPDLLAEMTSFCGWKAYMPFEPLFQMSLRTMRCRLEAIPAALVLHSM
jgi:hypothetical protein